MSELKQLQSQFKSADFFVIRFPKYSIDALDRWQGDETELRDQLQVWIQDPLVKEALYIASPSLQERLDYWIKDPTSKKGRKIERVLAKYFIRMASRCTPFGMFSGVALGTISTDTRLAIEALHYKRKSRLDMLIPFQLKQKVWQNLDVFENLRIKSNGTIYKLGSTIRYIESQSSATEQLYSLSSIDSNEFVEAAIDICRDEIQVAEAISRICDLDDEFERQGVKEFVWDLMAADVLQVSLPMSLTRSGCIAGIIDYCHQCGLDEVADTLIQSQKKLADLDQDFGHSSAAYQEVLHTLMQLPIDVNVSSCVQTDLWYDTEKLRLQRQFIDSLMSDLSVLAQLSCYADQSLADFKSRFIAKYESHSIPLLEALDDESGVGFSTSSGVNTPILDGVSIPAGRSEQNYKLTALDKLLIAKLSGNQHVDEIVLTKADIDKVGPLQNAQLPPSYYACGSLIADAATSDGNDHISLFEFRGMGGPSAANTLGRFCHLDEQLLAATQSELAFEQSLYQNAILAEIVHFPEGKVGNVIARPQLREFEISLLADASVAQENQLELKDLHVFVQNNRVVLWSLKHNKEVVPRLSCAHNTRNNSLGLYGFLASLQNQNIAMPGFELPVALKEMAYTPRIRLGKLVLAPRRWRVDVTELTALLNHFSDATVHHLRRKYKLPRCVIYKEYDQKLLVDLHNVLALGALLDSIKQHTQQVELEECLQKELGSALHYNDKRYFNEVVLPLRNTEFKHQLVHFPGFMNDASYQSKFLNGDQWLCCKIYCGESLAEDILTDVLAPWLTDKYAKGELQRYFFLRYADPEFHIRLRLYIPEQSSLKLLQEQLSSLLNDLYQRSYISDVAWISYTRETQRYGGAKAMPLIEEIFTADSVCTLQLLSLGISDELLWKVVIKGCEQLLTDLNLSLSAKLNVTNNLRAAYGREFHENIDTRTSLGRKFRTNKAFLQALFENQNHDPELQHITDILAIRSNAIRSIVAQLNRLNQQDQLICSLEMIAASLLHMHTNRLLKGNGRMQELCIYDFLLKLYNQKKHLEK